MPAWGPPNETKFLTYYISQKIKDNTNLISAWKYSIQTYTVAVFREDK